jgi:tetratricopeptide (TPR) repeat protein
MTSKIESPSLLAESLLGEWREARGSPGADKFWADRLPRDEGVQQALAGAFDAIGVAAFNDGDAGGARDAFWALFLLRHDIVNRRPTDRAAIRDFATAEDLLGKSLLKLGNPEAANDLLGEALKYRRGLFSDDPADAHAAYLFGVALWRMAELSLAMGRATEELEWARQAREHLTWVDTQWPGISFVAAQRAEVEARLQSIASASVQR